LIAFAAKAGSTASDGDSKNSPFTAALVKYLPRPGLDLRKAFGFARDDVLKATNNKQEPFIYGSLGGDDVALVPAVTGQPPPTSPADPGVAARRDYEIALQIDEPSIWDSFIRNYPSGFYTDVAKARRDKLNAGTASVAATEKAKAAADEQKRLAIEGAKSAEQAKAAAQAKAAEDARVAAERKKAIEEAKVAEAERAKAAAQAKAAEAVRIAAELAKKADEAKVAEAERAKAAALAKAAEDALAEADKLKKADEAKAAEEAKLAATKVKDGQPIGPVATLTPSDDTTPRAPNPNPPALADIPRLLQAELRRVGCNTGAIDGNWNIAAQRSLSRFNESAGMKLDVKIVSLDALDAVRSKTSRICPLICEHGYKADGERCVKITCGVGTLLNDNDECEKKREKPTAKREEPRAKPEQSQREQVQAKPSEPQASGQIICSQWGCRPVRKGCRLEVGKYNTTSLNVEVCN
jgi:chemotaxis protein histidine kinase CheA